MLSHNKFKSLPDAIGSLSHLEILLLENNELETLSSDFSGLVQLRQLILSNNKFAKFPHVACELKHLEVLDLSHNSIESLPPVISKLQRLIVLKLNNNQIATFDQELCTLKELQVLDLSSNQLQEVLENVADMEKLNDIDLSDNRFPEFPKTVFSIPNLERLKFDQSNGTQLSYIPDEMEFSSISYLILSNNTLRTLPNTINGMRNVRSIIADHNDIHTLPDSICELPRLQVLHLNDNCLTSLPENFDNLSNLKDLRLHNNPLKTPPMDVCVSGVLQPIGRFIRRALEREGKVNALILHPALQSLYLTVMVIVKYSGLRNYSQCSVLISTICFWRFCLILCIFLFRNNHNVLLPSPIKDHVR